jgi:hypothetical protein
MYRNALAQLVGGGSSCGCGYGGAGGAGVGDVRLTVSFVHNTYPQLRYTVATDEPAHHQATELPCRAAELLIYQAHPQSYRATKLLG